MGSSVTEFRIDCVLEKFTDNETKNFIEYLTFTKENGSLKYTLKLYYRVWRENHNQVYSWVKKYNANGEEGLTDKRGHHKTDDEVDELERLRRENLRLKRQLEEKDRVVELLKKVKEYERM